LSRPDFLAVKRSRVFEASFSHYRPIWDGRADLRGGLLSDLRRPEGITGACRSIARGVAGLVAFWLVGLTAFPVADLSVESTAALIEIRNQLTEEPSSDPESLVAVNLGT